MSSELLFSDMSGIINFFLEKKLGKVTSIRLIVLLPPVSDQTATEKVFQSLSARLKTSECEKKLPLLPFLPFLPFCQCCPCCPCCPFSPIRPFASAVRVASASNAAGGGSGGSGGRFSQAYRTIVASRKKA